MVPDGGESIGMLNGTWLDSVSASVNESFANRSVDDGGSGGGGGFALLFEDIDQYFNRLNFTNETEPVSIAPAENCTNYLQTNGTNVTSCTDLIDFKATSGRNYWALILVLFPIFTLFGNVLVILSVYRERTLQTVTNYFIVSLALADLLVAVVVMPFAVYVLVNGTWALPSFVCDFYIAMDVTCSTSSIFNLVAISIDRYIAVTQPIKYAKHKNKRRIWMTIVLVWVISVAIGSPIVLGLNNTPDRVSDACLFYNSDFIIYSSLSSFYIPCIIMMFLYYNIFKALRRRALQSRLNRKPLPSEIKPGSVIENVANTRRLAETALGPVATVEEQPTNTGSGSGDDDDEPADECQIITNDKSTEFILATVVEEAASQRASDKKGACSNRGNVQIYNVRSGVPPVTRSRNYYSGKVKNVGNSSNLSISSVVASMGVPPPPSLSARSDANGNNDSGYAASQPDAPVADITPSRRLRRQTSKNGAAALDTELRRSVKTLVSTRQDNNGSTGSKKEKKATAAARFTIYKVNKASRKKREKSSAKKERKATKTLAIVLGVFLICWVPFFTCNIMDAMCSKLGLSCQPGFAAFLLTTWLGYMNSFVNPVIYTIFNPEFRKAFKKLMNLGP